MTDRFVPMAARLLSTNGFAYLLLLDKNKPDEIIENAEKKYNLKGKCLATKRFFNEKLSIVKFTRRKQA